ncbi:hypothetical protein GXP67_05465 [Rhodocytophaga rosea]|uniref:Lipoprotein n=1 Tax=Rhodocytophaga rosea TaxID=2704465 RepID=A0A6C0GEA3_9BACT|nr:hypothetical protein [Rhodocytophaga rosea]QHT66154.1 hypothetical protein GXP67_05465 [Rhodocytophaga rosea]
MRSVFVLSSLLLILACNQERESPEKEVAVKVDFQIEDSVVLLNKNFRVILKGTSQQITCRVAQDTVFLPSQLQDTTYTLVFEYGKFSLKFNQVYATQLLADQRMHWRFGTDKKPFNLVNGAISYEDYVSGRYSLIEYFKFYPQEQGCGIQFVNNID